MGKLKVEFEGVALAGNDLKGSAGTIQSNLDDMDRALAPLKSDWTGAAQGAYLATQAAWNLAMVDLKNFLDAIGNQTIRSGETFQDTEKVNRDMFPGA